MVGGLDAGPAEEGATDSETGGVVEACSLQQQKKNSGNYRQSSLNTGEFQKEALSMLSLVLGWAT